MKAKRYLAGIIILLALTGCGKVDVEDADMEDWTKVDNVHIYINETNLSGVYVDPDKYIGFIETEEDFEQAGVAWKFPALSQDYPLSEYDYLYFSKNDPNYEYWYDYVEYSETEQCLRFHNMNTIRERKNETEVLDENNSFFPYIVQAEEHEGERYLYYCDKNTGEKIYCMKEQPVSFTLYDNHSYPGIEVVAAIPKAFFEGKEIENIYKPGEPRGNGNWTIVVE